ncbi:hypothetical protein CLU79DRAFT_768100 [Phycomyces nitens]|nr:hypothetical protein CLU79DRAFT_768100 [Phycomyces nitens]
MLFSTRNVDKQLTGASVLQRAQMMEIMARQLGDTNYKALQNIAVALTPHGRFIDKATHIHTFFKSRFNNVPVELYFIMGFDTITRFMDPVYYAEGRDKVLQTFFRDSNLICADRPGYDDNAGVFWSDQVGPYTKRITRIKLDDNIACLSSTLARTKVKDCSAKDNELEKVLDKDIIDYIESQELYK